MSYVNLDSPEHYACMRVSRGNHPLVQSKPMRVEPDQGALQYMYNVFLLYVRTRSLFRAYWVIVTHYCRGLNLFIPQSQREERLRIPVSVLPRPAEERSVRDLSGTGLVGSREVSPTLKSVLDLEG